MAELLANYTDNTLKNSSLNQDELEENLEQIIEIFNHLTEKDIFLTIYQHQLSFRLLNQENLGESK